MDSAAFGRPPRKLRISSATRPHPLPLSRRERGVKLAACRVHLEAYASGSPLPSAVRLPPSALEQVPRLDFQVSVYQRRGQRLGEYVQQQYTFAGQIAEDLVTPGEDVGGGRGRPELCVAGLLDLDGLE